MVPRFVDCPAERIQEQWVNVGVRLRPATSLALSQGMSVRRVELESQDTLSRDALLEILQELLSETHSEALPEGVRIIVPLSSPDLVPALEDVRKARPDVNLWGRPLSEHLSVTRAAGRAGFPVLFSDRDAALLGSSLGLDLLAFYLFEPELAVPVEPFHSLLRAELGEGRTLWNIWFGRADEHFFVGQDGNVSLCSSWAGRPDRIYGRDTDSPETWERSEAHAALLSLLTEQGLPERCRSCPMRRRCQGAALAVTGEETCGQWPELITRVNLAARAMRPSRRRKQGAGSPSAKPKS